MSWLQACGSPAAAAAPSASVPRSPPPAPRRSVKGVVVVMAGTLQRAPWGRLGSSLGSASPRAKVALWGMFISFSANPALQSLDARRLAWAHAREESRLAYRSWAESGEADRAMAFVVYRAAEEREAAAARAFGLH